MMVELFIFTGIGVAALGLIWYLFFQDASSPTMPMQATRVAGVKIPKLLQPVRSTAKTSTKVEKPAPRKHTPLGGTCATCSTKSSMPFRCKYCDELHCDEHRLPENHACVRV